MTDKMRCSPHCDHHKPKESAMSILLKPLAIAALSIATLTTAASAQSVVIRSPIIACDSPTGVGCDGRTILKPGTYRLDHVVPYTGICRVSGPNGGGYTRCSAFAKKPRGNW